MSIRVDRVPARHAGRRQPSTCAAAWVAVWVIALAAIPVHSAWAEGNPRQLSYAQALALAREAAPALKAAQAALAGATALLPAASTAPDPRLSVGVENLPVTGPDRWRVTRDTGTMQRIGLMQEVPHRDKREARAQAAQARLERDRALLAATELAVRREAGLAWLAVHYAEARRALLDGLVRENQLLQDTLPARIASGAAQPAERTQARQEGLALADRGDELARDVRRARAQLRRWVGERADAPLHGEPPAVAVHADTVRSLLPRHADLAPFGPLRAVAVAEVAEAQAEGRGDWAWEVAYSRRPRYDDMVSFQLRFDLPWQRERRQQPQAEARRREVDRIEAERDDALRRLVAETEAMLAEWQALDVQAERLRTTGLPLAAERMTLAMAAYQSGRGDLSSVLAARGQVLEARLRAIELDAQRAALGLRLSTLIAE